MKKMILLLTVLAAVSVAYAQEFALGVKAGANMSKLSTKCSGVNEEVNYGFVGGVFARVGVLGFYVQPEALFNQRKGDFSASGMKATTTLNYIDVPILAGKKFFKIIHFNLGPNLQFLMSASQSGDTDPNFSKSNFNNFAVGGIAGVGLDISKLTLDLRYDFSISNLGKTISDKTGTSYDYSTRANMFQVTLGYKFISE